MAKVIAKVDCFIDNSFRRAGDVFELNGPLNVCVEYADGEQPKEPAVKRGRKQAVEVTEAAE